jgi:hypothetical protein
VHTVASETPDSSIAYRQRVENVIAALGSDGQRGLSEDAARSRLERYSGPPSRVGCTTWCKATANAIVSTPVIQN